MICENVIDPTRCAGVAYVGVAAISSYGERAILTIDRGASSSECAGCCSCPNTGHSRTISTLGIDTSSAARCTNACNNIARFRCVCTGGDAIGVVACGRHVINDVNRKIGRRCVTVAVGYNHGKHIVRCRIRRVIGQCIAVADIASSNAGNGKRAEWSYKNLSNGGDSNTI